MNLLEYKYHHIVRGLSQSVPFYLDVLMVACMLSIVVQLLVETALH